MKRFFGRIRRFFLPPADARTFIRLVPLFAVGLIVIALFVAGNYAWEKSNSPVFCGTACHTMPPEYVSYQNSPHTNVTCEDCHMGRDTLGVMVQRKVRYSWQTGSAMVLNTYEYPIFAKNMAPARDACENCHKPEKFSADKLVELKHYADDESNTASSTFLVIHTGGGTSRQGLGYGIHWHIENKVSYYTTDKLSQDIPYVVVEKTDGTKVEYVDAKAYFDTTKVQPSQLKTMDCITCHNRTAHLFSSPEEAMDDLITRGLVSATIPEIKKKGVEVLSATYDSDQAAMEGIAVLTAWYKNQKPDFAAANGALIASAVQSMQESWKQNNFLDQKVTWETHPNELAHKDFPGCFRCHDGKHMAVTPVAGIASTIRLECNLCHSVPVISGPAQLTANVQVSKGFEPESHKNPNWISLHNQVFNDECKGCHTTEDAGGTSNTSFCSNGACHGATWDFAGFDAPQLRAVLAEQAKAMIPTPTATQEATATPVPVEGSDEGGATPQPSATPGAAASGGGAGGSSTTFAELGPVLKDKCGTCHGSAAIKGLNVLTYASLMKGSAGGPVVVAGDPKASKIVQVQKAGGHPGQLAPDQLDLLVQWITAGAPEK